MMDIRLVLTVAISLSHILWWDADGCIELKGQTREKTSTIVGFGRTRVREGVLEL
jgi:hypothetical protein